MLVARGFQIKLHYHTMRHLQALKIYSCGKHCEKRRNCNMALIFYSECTLKMSSAICFNLDQSKILSSANGLMLYHTIQNAQVSDSLAIMALLFGDLDWEIFYITHGNKPQIERY